MTSDDVIAARRYLTELGYLEDSGKRRPDRAGQLQPVYRISALGRIADEYHERGHTLEEAMDLARASANGQR
jgi:hypothetical protein